MNNKPHTITECTVAVMTAHGPAGETMPLIELCITAHSETGQPSVWPPLRLQLHRALQLKDMLQAALADAHSLLHQARGPMQ
jgi:hypothetical protein